VNVRSDDELALERPFGPRRDGHVAAPGELEHP
jgi:hypothetical protein